MCSIKRSVYSEDQAELTSSYHSHQPNSRLSQYNVSMYSSLFFAPPSSLSASKGYIILLPLQPSEQSYIACSLRSDRPSVPSLRHARYNYSDRRKKGRDTGKTKGESLRIVPIFDVVAGEPSPSDNAMLTHNDCGMGGGPVANDTCVLDGRE